MVLACQLACSGYGGYAFIVLLLGAAAPVFGFYLLSTAFEKRIKPWRQMDQVDRRRVGLRALFLALGISALLLLIAQFTKG